MSSSSFCSAGLQQLVPGGGQRCYSDVGEYKEEICDQARQSLNSSVDLKKKNELMPQTKRSVYKLRGSGAMFETIPTHQTGKGAGLPVPPSPGSSLCSKAATSSSHIFPSSGPPSLAQSLPPTPSAL